MLSVIIPTYQRPHAARRLVSELLAQRDMPSFEIIVVSNLADEGLRRVIEAASATRPDVPVHYRTVGIVGANRARNAGMAQARGDLWLLLDDDCSLGDPGYLARVVRLHTRDFPGAAAIGGPYLLPTASSFMSRVYHALSLHWYLGGVSQAQSSRLLGGCVSYKKDMIGRRRFDERIAFGASEVEFHFRLDESGLSLVGDPRHAVFHTPLLTLGAFLRKRFLQGRATVVYLAPYRRPTDSTLSFADVLDWFVGRPGRIERVLLRASLVLADTAFRLGCLSKKGVDGQKIARLAHGVALLVFERIAQVFSRRRREAVGWSACCRIVHRLASEERVYAP